MKQTGRYLVILAAALVLWNSTIIKPLKIFTVILHELGHALMAFVFGYGIQGFNVSYNEGGYTLVQSKGWFSSFMIANGGYLGSLFFAILILYLKRTALKNYIIGGLAILFLGLSIKFSGFSFTLLYSAVFTIFALFLYMARNEKLNEWVIDIIGITSVAYAVYDTFVDTILLQLNLKLHLIQGWRVSQPMTDAVQLSQMTGIPATIWGIIWLAIALFAVYTLLIRAPGPRKSPKR